MAAALFYSEITQRDHLFCEMITHFLHSAAEETSLIFSDFLLAEVSCPLHSHPANRTRLEDLSEVKELWAGV